MTERRQRMSACLQRRGVSARTPERDVRTVRQLAEHSPTSPDVITAEELRPNFLSSTHVQPDSRRASPIARCGLTCCVDQTLHSEGTTLRCVRAPRAKKLPGVLRFAAVRGRLGCVRRPRDRVCLATLAAWGRRLQEGTPLPVRDLDRSRMLSHVRHGQGGTARAVPRPHRTLARLRHSGGTPRHPVLRFPAPGRGGPGVSTATAPMPRNRGPGAGRAALHASGLPTPASGPTLRQAGATHVLEAGGHLRRRHASLGPRSPTPTRVSTPLTARAEHRGAQALNRRMQALCWGRARSCSASMARRPARPSATGCCPGIGGPCRRSSAVAQRRSAARSLTVRPATRIMTATTRVSTGTVPRASRTMPSRGWHITSGGGGRCHPAGCPVRSRRNAAGGPAAPRNPATPSAFGAPPQPSRPWRWLHRAAAAGSGGGGLQSLDPRSARPSPRA